MSSWVNPKVRISDAGQKGRGLFAREKIKKGGVVTIATGQIIEDKKFEEYPFTELWNHCFRIDKNFSLCPQELRVTKLDSIFITNHSCDPSCGFNGPTTLIAIRDINRGEEITFDYAMSDMNYPGMGCHPDEPMECLCGSKHCHKFVSYDVDWLNKDLQEKYRGYFSPYIQRMIDELNSN